jgi:hypothetical protein
MALRLYFIAMYLVTKQFTHERRGRPSLYRLTKWAIGLVSQAKEG